MLARPRCQSAGQVVQDPGMDREGTPFLAEVFVRIGPKDRRKCNAVRRLHGDRTGRLSLWPISESVIDQNHVRAPNIVARDVSRLSLNHDGVFFQGNASRRRLCRIVVYQQHGWELVSHPFVGIEITTAVEKPLEGRVNPTVPP